MGSTPALTSEATQPTTGKLSCHELSRMETEKLEALRADAAAIGHAGKTGLFEGGDPLEG